MVFSRAMLASQLLLGLKALPLQPVVGCIDVLGRSLASFQHPSRAHHQNNSLLFQECLRLYAHDARHHTRPGSVASGSAGSVLQQAQVLRKLQVQQTYIKEYNLNLVPPGAVSHPSCTRLLHSGLVNALPASLQPYAHLMRLEKPIGTWLLMWPGFWSIAMAAAPGSLPDWYLLTLFGVGSVLLRGAGCTINDLWDHDLDRKVERTRTRPLASGALTPAHAVGLLGIQLLAGLWILLQLNDFSKLMGASSLLLVFTYPLMKRITFWPQAFLGLTINWGALLGWAAVHGSCDWAVVLPLYLAGVNWTLVYDTIYAHQDKRDDVAAGIKSTALLFGDKTKQWLTGFSAAHLALLTAGGLNAGMGPLYYLGLVVAGGHLTWQISTVNLDNPLDCLGKFVSNQWYGGLVFVTIVADRVASSISA